MCVLITSKWLHLWRLLEFNLVWSLILHEHQLLESLISEAPLRFVTSCNDFSQWAPHIHWLMNITILLVLSHRVLCVDGRGVREVTVNVRSFECLLCWRTMVQLLVLLLIVHVRLTPILRFDLGFLLELESTRFQVLWWARNINVDICFSFFHRVQNQLRFYSCRWVVVQDSRLSGSNLHLDPCRLIHDGSRSLLWLRTIWAQAWERWSVRSVLRSCQGWSFVVVSHFFILRLLRPNSCSLLERIRDHWHQMGISLFLWFLTRESFECLLQLTYSVLLGCHELDSFVILVRFLWVKVLIITISLHDDIFSDDPGEGVFREEALAVRMDGGV